MKADNLVYIRKFIVEKQFYDVYNNIYLAYDEDEGKWIVECDDTIAICQSLADARKQVKIFKKVQSAKRILER